MNGQRRNYQNTYQQQNSGYQQQNRSQQADPNRWERQNLERELRQKQGQLTMLDARIDALGVQGKQIEADLQAHTATIPAAVVTEILRAVTNAVGIPFLPQAYRNWYYKRERLLQLENRLRYQAIAFYHQRQALVEQIEQLAIDIDLLKYTI